MKYAYVVSRTLNIRSRFEEVSMALALHDAGVDIRLVSSEDAAQPNEMIIGRREMMKIETSSIAGPFDSLHNLINTYWQNPIIASHMNRKFEVCYLSRAEQLFEDWRGIFFKSTKSKELTLSMPYSNGGFYEQLKGWQHTFIDRGDCILAQELVEIDQEVRTVIVNGVVVTSSLQRAGYTPQHPDPEMPPSELINFAADIATKIESWSHYNLDVAFINGKPGIVECNPMDFGRLGLYACDPNAIARAVVDCGIL